MKHVSYGLALKLTQANMYPVLLMGEAGCGKTTMAEQIAEELSIKFFAISLTRQTTLSHIMGFMSVNGTYVPSQLRQCVENGGMFLLDELDAGDANVLLSLNTIENGYVSFPDGIVKCHKDFRLIAAANPQDQHQRYTGRSKLDAATLDRFDKVTIPRDDNLEKSLVDHDTHQRMQLLRQTMKDQNCTKLISMRDAVRYQNRKNLDLLDDDFMGSLVEYNDLVLEIYHNEVGAIPKHVDQSECQTFDDLIDLLKVRAGEKPNAKTKSESGESSPEDPYGYGEDSDN
jgi:MoxR-like ATPase